MLVSALVTALIKTHTDGIAVAWLWNSKRVPSGKRMVWQWKCVEEILKGFSAHIKGKNGIHQLKCPPLMKITF